MRTSAAVFSVLVGTARRVLVSTRAVSVYLMVERLVLYVCTMYVLIFCPPNEVTCERSMQGGPLSRFSRYVL